MIDEDTPQAAAPAVTSTSALPADSILPLELSGPSQSLSFARPHRRGETQSVRNRMSMFGLEDEDDGENMRAEPISKRFKAEFESNLMGGTFKDIEEDEMDLDPEADLPDCEPPSQSIRRNTRRSQSVLSDSGPRGGTSLASGGSQTQSATQRKTSVSKRKILSDVEEDVDSAVGTSALRGRSKRQATENANPVAATTSTNSQHVQPLTTNQTNVPDTRKNATGDPAEKRGAAANGTDTAPEFLQALASKKKGKRKEDAFDREFNNLRITKPRNGVAEDLEQERARVEEMEVWDEIAKDMNITGNFMVIIESDDILRKDGGRKESAPIPDAGVPNFKRFKKVCSLAHKAIITQSHFIPESASKS